MNDDELRLAERLASDLERVLDTGILVEDLEIAGEGPVTIRVACLIDGQAREIEATGATEGEAVGEVIRQAAETRLDASFWRIVGPS